jgi:hypothetical protein
MESDSGEPSFIHHVTPRPMAVNILDKWGLAGAPITG